MCHVYFGSRRDIEKLQVVKIVQILIVTQSCLCNPMNCSLPGSSVHGVLQARILEWVAIPLISANTLSCGQHLCEKLCVCVCVCVCLNFFPSGILFPEEEAMSPFHGLQLLLYLANFKIPTKNKYFAMSQ